jgi:hypothetical protein
MPPSSLSTVSPSVNSQPKNDTNIIFPNRAFSDGGDIVSITGRLAGDGVGYKNNAETISCYKQEKECELQDLEQIGPNQIGGLMPALSLPITRWDEQVITASDSEVTNPGACSHVTINIDRKMQVALYVQQPANQTALFCQHTDAKTYKWTVEHSLWEERALGKK